jgi:superfamily I DNA/RNA helicase
LRKLFGAYVEAKQKQNVLDYDDLLLYWAQMMVEGAVAQDVADRFDHVLVDEYQDTNRLQASILLALKPNGASSRLWSAIPSASSEPTRRRRMSCQRPNRSPPVSMVHAEVSAAITRRLRLPHEQMGATRPRRTANILPWRGARIRFLGRDRSAFEKPLDPFQKHIESRRCEPMRAGFGIGLGIRTFREHFSTASNHDHVTTHT